MTKITLEQLKVIDAYTMNHLQRCRNAGQISIRHPTKESDSWFRIPNLSYQPFYDYKELEDEIKRLKEQGLVLAVALAIGAIFCLYIAYSGQLLNCLIFAVCLTPLAVWLGWDFERLMATMKQWHDCQQHVPIALPEESLTPVEINWWSLVRQGFSPVLTRSYNHNQWGLRGKPWRMLVNDQTGEKIPVIRINAYKMPLIRSLAVDNQLFLQSCAALILENESGPINWGLVFDSSSFQCLAIPIHASDIEAIPDRVKRAKEWFLQHSELEFIQPPVGICELCTYAVPSQKRDQFKIDNRSIKPHWYKILQIIDRMIEQGVFKKLDFRRLDGNDIDEDHSDDGFERTEFREWVARSPRPQASFHSECGDLFEWEPVHSIWINKITSLYERYLDWLRHRNAR